MNIQEENTSSFGFQEYMVDVINKGSLSLMLSLGHRVGLFDTMVSLPPSTSKQISIASNLDERYVREWLAAMVVGKIVNYDLPIICISCQRKRQIF